MPAHRETYEAGAQRLGGHLFSCIPPRMQCVQRRSHNNRPCAWCWMPAPPQTWPRTRPHLVTPRRGPAHVRTPQPSSPPAAMPVGIRPALGRCGEAAPHRVATGGAAASSSCKCRCSSSTGSSSSVVGGIAPSLAPRSAGTRPGARRLPFPLRTAEADAPPAAIAGDARKKVSLVSLGCPKNVVDGKVGLPLSQDWRGDERGRRHVMVRTMSKSW
eukprot:361255-Chlamydomonas_euryale.AAC.5